MEPMGCRHIYVAFCSLLLLLILIFARNEISEDKTSNKKTTKYKIGQQSQTPSSLDYIESIRHDCGELCDTTRNGSDGKYFNYIKTNIDCESIFKNPYLDMPGKFTQPPKYIPTELYQYYSMNGRIEVKHRYFDNRNSTIENKIWTKDIVDDYISKAQLGLLAGPYRRVHTNQLRNGLKYTPGIKNGRILVVGSITPWVEACVLEAGAHDVLTLEYGHLTSLHPALKTITPQEFTQQYLDKTLGTFDAVVTYSSVEHSGLGRYGDTLNPWGDIITIARTWCVTKAGGGLLLAIPYAEIDEVHFNAHRIYGPSRYPYLTTNWKQIYKGTGSQTPFSFSKIDK